MDNIEIEILDKKDFTSELLADLKPTLEKGYHKSHMYTSLLKDLEKEHTFFKAFVAFLNDKVVGNMILEDNYYDSVEYHGYHHYHLQRVCVDSNFRGYGIGQKLITALKEYVFNSTDIDVFFGESNETGAMNFYLKSGALFNKKTIENYTQRNSKENNLAHFKEFVTNKKFKNYRYQTGGGIDFVYCKDEKIEQIFREKGYFGKEFLENN